MPSVTVCRLNAAVATCPYFPVRRCCVVDVYTFDFKNVTNFFFQINKNVTKFKIILCLLPNYYNFNI